MSTHDHVLDDEDFDFDIGDPIGWPALGWIILSAMVTVTAFLLAPMP